MVILLAIIHFKQKNECIETIIDDDVNKYFNYYDISELDIIILEKILNDIKISDVFKYHFNFYLI